MNVLTILKKKKKSYNMSNYNNSKTNVWNYKTINKLQIRHPKINYWDYRYATKSKHEKSIKFINESNININFLKTYVLSNKLL
jgi:hypothetical protein